MTSALLIGRKVRLSWNGATLVATVVSLDTSCPDTAYSVSWRFDENPQFKLEPWMDGAKAVCSVAHHSQISVAEA